MNKDHTLSLIRQRFRNVTEMANDLFRAELRDNGSVIGVFYFDLSQPLRRSDFNLSEYLQDVITSDFYKHEGSLQWNYYLYFILDKPLFKRVSKDGTAAKIEADRAFARKFVKSEELFDKELTKPLAETVRSSRPPKDITATWTLALLSAGLGKICDPNAPYTQIVEDFLSGVAEEKHSLEHNVPLPSTDLGRPISKLLVKKFRTHPSTPSFEFAKVNLIRGANGAGKTSLLEAIELSICGGIRRQDGARPPAARLDLTFAGDDQPQRCPQVSSTLYRARDLAWYGQYNRIGNRLCYNFGRFNFFDSDAAFRLSYAENSEEIKDAIGALFLGEQANTLEERMVACKERFQAEERQLSKKLTVLLNQAKIWRSDIKELEKIVDTREALLNEVRLKASATRWKTLPVQPDPKHLVGLKESVDDLISELGEVTRQLHWVPVVSVKTLNEERQALAKLLRDTNALVASVSELSKTIAATKDDLSLIESELRILERLGAYHHEPNAFSLVGMKGAIQQSKGKLEQLAKATDLVKKVDVESFKSVEMTFTELRRARQAEITRQRKLLSRKRTTLEQLKGSIENTRALVEQIKGLGHRFCELNPESRDCPLCGHYELDRLLERIGPLKSKSGADSALRELAAEVQREEIALSKMQTLSRNLETLGEAAALVLTETELDSATLKSIVLKLSGFGEERSEEQGKLEDLIVTQSLLARRGYSESEISKLLSEAKKVLDLSESSLRNGSIVSKTASKHQRRVRDLTPKLAKMEKEEKETLRKLRLIRIELLGTDAFFDPVVELERRLSVVEETLDSLPRLQNNVFVDNSDDFAGLRTRLVTFSASLARTQRALKQVEEKDVLEKRLGSSLKESEKEISRLHPRNSRAEQALSLIEGLLKSENKEQYLAETVADHHEKLSTLFCKIHAPHEFEEVHLNAEFTLKRSNGTKSNISEISTGQRSALALSIFLTMNSSISTRAPWLIFDDPVAHVDDLNILSFFDTLRDLVLIGNQQVFFATASSRIADLFVRKFDFLGAESLKEFPLDRPN